jgi:hypothetical protein
MMQPLEMNTIRFGCQSQVRNCELDPTSAAIRAVDNPATSAELNSDSIHFTCVSIVDE